MAPKRDEILQDVLRLAKEKLGTANGAAPTATTNLADLPRTDEKDKAIKSLITSLENKYIGVTFPLDVRSDCNTIDAIVDFIFDNQDG
jgi:hypothetical protein